MSKIGYLAKVGSPLTGIAIVCAPAHASGTLAGTKIDNIATATFDEAGGARTITSNIVSLRVDELLDVVVSSSETGSVDASNGDANRVLKFQITNAGNGPEAYALSATGAVGGDDFDPSVTSLAIDSNGSGTYDPGVDAVYAPGSNDPLLQPDASLAVFLLASMPASAADGARGIARLTATAVTGSGTPGTLLAGAGQGGGDAIVGATTARAEADGAYRIAAVSVVFVKSAAVLDPFGGTRAVPGSIITYQLRAEVTGGGLSNLRLSDAIPAGTRYRPGSLTLNGAALTDASDADAGTFAANAISVAIPAAAAGSVQTATFKTVIE